MSDELINVQVRHDCPLTVTLTTRDGRLLHTSTTTADLLDGHLTVIGITWNALSVSGGVQWRHPLTGELLKHAPVVTYKIADESFILRDGQLCECAKCVPALTPATRT